MSLRTCACAVASRLTEFDATTIQAQWWCWSILVLLLHPHFTYSVSPVQVLCTTWLFPTHYFICSYAWLPFNFLSSAPTPSLHQNIHCALYSLPLYLCKHLDAHIPSCKNLTYPGMWVTPNTTYTYARPNNACKCAANHIWGRAG